LTGETLQRMNYAVANRARSLSFLILGTGLTFAVALAATSVTARLYEPADFGTLASFLAWVAVPAAVANFRLSDAIPLSKTPAREACLIQASLEATLIVCVLLSGLVAGLALLDVLPLPLTLFLPLAIAVVAASSVHRVACMVATKGGHFGWLMALTVALPLTTGLGQVLGWYLGWSLTTGTAIGTTLCAAAAAVSLLPRVGGLTLQRPMLPIALHELPEFAKYAAPFAAVVAIRTRGLYFIIGLPNSRISSNEAGLLQQAERVSGWANSGLTSVLRPAFHHSATIDAQQASIHSIATSGLLLQLMAGPATLLALYSNSVIEIALGPAWEQAVGAFQWLVIPTCMFAAVGFSDRLFDMMRRQGALLALESTAAMATIAAGILCSVLGGTVQHLAIALALITTLYGIGQFVLLGVLCRANWTLLVKPILNAALICGLVTGVSHVGKTLLASPLPELLFAFGCPAILLARRFRRVRGSSA
jgi:O-antigen/teichoic acid export membrane protein